MFGVELGARELDSAVPDWSGDSRELQSRAASHFFFFAKKPNMSKDRGSWVYLFDPVIKRSILRLHSQ